MAERIPSSEAAFEAFFKAHYPSLVQYALRFVSDMDSARDLAQQVFVKVYEKRDQIVIKGTVRGYLFQALKNTALNQLNRISIREKHQQIVANQSTTIADLHQEIEGNELKEQLMNVIEALPERCRLIFKMNRFEGKRNLREGGRT